MTPPCTLKSLVLLCTCHMHTDQSGARSVCAVQGGEEQSFLELSKATCPSWCVWALTGNETSLIIFHLEERQGARLEKGNKSHLIIYKVRSPFKKSISCSSTPSPSARPHSMRMEREEKAFSHLLGSSKILHLSSPSHSLTMKGEFCSLSFQGQVSFYQAIRQKAK